MRTTRSPKRPSKVKTRPGKQTWPGFLLRPPGTIMPQTQRFCLKSKNRNPDTLCIKITVLIWWTRGDSNSRPLQCECNALPAALRAQVVVPQARKILYVFFASVSRDFLKIGGKSAGLIIGGSRNDQAGRNGGGGVSRLPPRRSGGSPPFRRGCFCIRRRPPAPG